LTVQYSAVGRAALVFRHGERADAIYFPTSLFIAMAAMPALATGLLNGECAFR
jgi:hypothetical protein